MRSSTRRSASGKRNASDIATIKAKNIIQLPRGACLKIQCTDCGAQCGEPCLSKTTGRPMQGAYHKSRKHKVMQAWHAQREMQTIELPEDSTD